MNENTILGGLDPEIIERVGTRREALGGMGRLGLGLAMTSVPLAFTAMAKRAFAQTALPQAVKDVLNFALTLEYLEAEFYIQATSGTSTINFPAGVRQVFTIIRDHEIAHVEFLRNALGAEAVPKPQFDFTAGGAFPNVFSDYTTFVTLSQAFEDTGVRAYKGQVPQLLPYDDVLTAALKIHSVEARHASKVRRLAGSPAEQGWIPFTQPGAPAPIAPVYMGEAETVQAGVPVLTVISGLGVTEEDVTEAFDEPLTKAEVLAIVDQFIVGDLDGDGTEA